MEEETPKKEGRFLRKLKIESPLSIKPQTLLIILLVLGAGVLTGFFIPKGKVGAGGRQALKVEEGKPPPPTLDVKTFRDKTEGVIEPIKDRDVYTQGTHLLIRDDAPPANLTSSVIDLDQYVGKRVVVYGETFGSDRVGWLMDVGRIEEK